MIGILYLISAAIVRQNLQSQSVREKDWENTLRFTFVCPIPSGDEYWNAAYAGMQSAAAELGNVDVSLDGPKQISEGVVRTFDTAVAAQVDGIISTGTRKDIAERINTAAESGIPVALIDTDAPESERVCYIGLDNYQLGVEGGNFIAERTGGDARIAVIRLSETAQNFIDRECGLEAVIGSYPDMEIVTARTAQNALAASEEVYWILDQYPEVDTVFCIDGTTPKGAAQALKELNAEDRILCLGLSDDQEIVERIRDGSLDATIGLQPYEMGYRAVKNLVNHIEGVSPEETVIPDIILVTLDNIEEFIKLKGYQ